MVQAHRSLDRKFAFALFGSFVAHGALLLMPLELPGSGRGGEIDHGVRLNVVLKQGGETVLRPQPAIREPETGSPAPVPILRPESPPALGVPRAVPIKTERFFELKDLDAAPVGLTAPEMDLAALADARGFGRVVVRVWIDVDGRVVRCQIEEGDDPYSATVRDGFLAARFLPGRRNGQAVRSVVSFEVGFPP